MGSERRDASALGARRSAFGQSAVLAARQRSLGAVQPGREHEQPLAFPTADRRPRRRHRAPTAERRPRQSVHPRRLVPAALHVLDVRAGIDVGLPLQA